MKNIQSILTIGSTALISTLFFTGCSQEARNEAADTYEEATETTKTISNDTQEWFTTTWKSVDDYTSEQRDAFVENLEKARKTINQQATEFTESGAEVTKEARASYEDASKALQEQLAKASEASDEAWEENKSNVQKAWKDLKAATNHLMNNETVSKED
jgi:PBP1b-binding outer membrane lipoprotein LpoB